MPGLRDFLRLLCCLPPRDDEERSYSATTPRDLPLQELDLRTRAAKTSVQRLQGSWEDRREAQVMVRRLADTAEDIIVRQEDQIAAMQDELRSVYKKLALQKWLRNSDRQQRIFNLRQQPARRYRYRSGY